MTTSPMRWHPFLLGLSVAGMFAACSGDKGAANNSVEPIASGRYRAARFSQKRRLAWRLLKDYI